jgi:RHS repeat-associated protein
VTSVTTYADAPNAAQAITHSTSYDIAGNVMTAQVDCCQQKSITYWNSNGSYAYPTPVTSGNPSGTHLTTSASFDYNTGLTSTTTDENSQVTTASYNNNSNSLRTSEIDYPDSGQTLFVYSDGLDSSSHFNVETRVKLTSSGYIDSYRFFDGRGAVTRSLGNHTSADGYMTQDIEYDTMGRAYRASNPYYASSSSAAINSDGYWTTSTFDHLGRVTQVQMPRGDNDNSLTTSVTTSYDGIYTTVTDQAGKVRRQKVDALGRVVRLDEPTSSGLGSTSSPNQKTDYYYDALDNLVRINQDSQNRYFKFDSLSRLIRERQVEQNTNSSYDLSDSLTSNSSWSRRIDYNSSGLVTDGYDARGLHTTFSYDDLNRVYQITYSDSTPAAHYFYDSQTLPSGAPSYTHSNTTGRLLAMTYGSSSSTTGNYFAYDVMGRVTTQKQVTGSATYGLSYAYNYAGQLTGETYPGTRALAYHYDDGGRLSQVDDGTTTFANTFTYAAHGGLTSETWGNTAVHAMTYNRRLQASQVKLSLATTVQQQYDYSYGQFDTTYGTVDTSKNNGQIGKVLGTIGTTAQWNQGFSYDELGRLSNVTEHQGSSMSTQTYSQSYTFDRYGNRFQSANSTLGLIGVSSSEIDAATNRFITTGSTPTTYDAAGNITTDTKFRGMNYQYDANGRLTYSYSTDNVDGASSTYDCAGQRVQTLANNVTRTMVYDIFGQLVADYLGSSGSTLERENIYRGRQLLAVYETGASCYKSISQFVQDFYQGVLQRQPNSTELTNWTATLTQAQGQGHLIVAAQSLGETLFTSSEYSGLSTSNSQFVTDLYAGYLGRAPDGYGGPAWTAALNNGTSRAEVRHGFAYSAEFQNDVGQLCVTTSSTSASLKYVLSDLQGTMRAVTNNNGSSSAVIARHDYLPFGEEIWAGSYRSSSYSYGVTDGNRQKYGLTERDDATGLDHTWWRKLESFSGRWTSPDPYNGSMAIANPQSFSRYTYVGNDPLNLIDPTGLKPGDLCSTNGQFNNGIIGNDGKCYAGSSTVVTVGIPPSLFGDYLPDWTSGQTSIVTVLLGGSLGGTRTPTPTPTKPPPPAKPSQPPQKQSRRDCVLAAAGKYLGAQFLSLAKIVAFKAGLDVNALVVVLSLGTSAEAEGLLEGLDLLKAQGTLASAGGVGIFGMGYLLAEEVKQVHGNDNEYQRALQACFAK